MKFYIAARWQNKDGVRDLADELTKRGYEVYSFLNSGANLSSGRSATEELSAFGEAMENWGSDDRIKRIFDSEMDGLRTSDAVILLEPAGRSSLLEAGIGYGLGKKIYAVGPIERPEVVYLICEHFYQNPEEFLRAFPGGA